VSTEEKRAYNKRYYEEHREYFTRHNKNYYASHREEEKARSTIYQKTRPDKTREINLRAQARYRQTPQGRWSKKVYAYRKRNVSVGRIDKDAWHRKVGRFGGRCATCGSAGTITIDHIVPLSAGGTNKIENLQPLCKSCNSAKGSRSLAEFMERNSLPV